MKIVLVLCLFSFFISFFSPAAAQNANNRPFAQMDTNQDGKLSKDEYMTYQMDMAKKVAEFKFSKIDTNSDGELSQDEINEALVKFKEAMEKRKHN